MQHFHVDIGAVPPVLAGVSSASSADNAVVAVVLGSPAQQTQADALLNEYLRARRVPPERCGAVGIVLRDTSKNLTTVLAPPIGHAQIYWSVVNNRLLLASRPAAILDTAPELRKPAASALFQYVYFHSLPSPTSIHPHVQKLPCGHRLQFDGRSASIDRYWNANFEDNAKLTEAEATSILKEQLSAAVGRAIDRTERFGCFLSGGLDSSTVSGFAAQIRPGVATVSMGFDAQGYDEIEFARLASRRFGTKALEYYVQPDDVLATLPDIAAAFPEPFGNSSAAAAFHCARIAREHGLDLLLAGDGGDEIFGGNERYAKQLVFERYDALPRWLRGGLLEPTVNTLAKVTRAFPVGKAHSYIKQAAVPLPDRLQSYNFLHRHDPRDVFAPELLAAVDTGEPLRLLRDEYAAPQTSSAVNRMLFLDWKFTLHDNDLVKVNTMCDLAGVRVAYPMLDAAVVDFSMRLPGDWKVRDGELRWFFKRAMTGFLPREIIHKTKHGFGLPFGVWTRTHQGLGRLAADCLESLARRGYFRSEFIREALRMHREGHAGYYGELVWILMVLELWLQRHMPKAAL